MRLRRSTNSTDNETDNKVERHCIVICNSPPYLMPSIQSDLYFGKNCDQLVAIMKEVRLILRFLKYLNTFGSLRGQFFF